MAHRYTIEELPNLIRREGGMVDLFMKTTMAEGEAPDEIWTDVVEINRLWWLLQERFRRVAEACGYDEDEEN